MFNEKRLYCIVLYRKTYLSAAKKNPLLCDFLEIKKMFNHCDLNTKFQNISLMLQPNHFFCADNKSICPVEGVTASNQTISFSESNLRKMSIFKASQMLGKCICGFEKSTLSLQLEQWSRLLACTLGNNSDTSNSNLVATDLISAYSNSRI